MSIFGSIVSKILGRHGDATPASDDAASPAAASSQQPSPSAGPSTQQPSPSAGPSTQQPGASAGPSAQQTGASAGSSAQQTAAPVDVEAVLAGMASKAPQTLDWRHSIVDLLKLLDLDSGLAARRELARELNYGGSTEDTAAMNTWLHRQVMAKLAENGGRVPDSLRV